LENNPPTPLCGGVGILAATIGVGRGGGKENMFIKVIRRKVKRIWEVKKQKSAVKGVCEK
jgi:hypothetical protein